MTIVEQIQSFYKRRIAIPVKRGELVLDIGSGDKPHWRSDVLVDEYIDDSQGIQRSGNSKVAVTRPLVVAPVEKMPFKDKVFDYVFASHILEHVMDPKKALEEIIRVGKAGYIEVPFEGAAKVIDVPSHLWYCRMEKGKLVMTAKKTVAFDKVIDSLMSKRPILYAFAKIGQDNWDDFILQIHWKETIAYKVIGRGSKKLFDDAMKEEGIHNKKNFFLRSILSSIIVLPFFYKKNFHTVDVTEIMQCTNCKGAFSKKQNKVVCKQCKKSVQVLM